MTREQPHAAGDTENWLHAWQPEQHGLHDVRLIVEPGTQLAPVWHAWVVAAREAYATSTTRPDGDGSTAMLFGFALQRVNLVSTTVAHLFHEVMRR